TRVRPAGRRSVTSTPVAGSGPWSISVTVNEIWSPTLGVAFETTLVSARSALTGVGVLVDADAVSLLVFESGRSEWLIEAVLVCEPAVSTEALKESVAQLAPT